MYCEKQSSTIFSKSQSILFIFNEITEFKARFCFNQNVDEGETDFMKKSIAHVFYHCFSQSLVLVMKMISN